jgi:hypothetical protein
MQRLIVIACVVFAAAACGKNKFEQAASDLEGFRDKMCACKDKSDKAAQKDCADGVKKDIDEWKKDMRAKHKDDKDEPPEGVLKRVKTAEKEGRACYDAVASGDSERIIQDMKDQICACKDMKCADTVSKKFAEQAASKDMAAKSPTEKELRLAKELGECMQKLANAPAGGAAAP